MLVNGIDEAFVEFKKFNNKKYIFLTQGAGNTSILASSLNKVENLKNQVWSLRGGYSNERNISLKSAEAVNIALNEEGINQNP